MGRCSAWVVLAIGLCVVSCSESPPTTPIPTPATLVVTVLEPPGPNCANGGIAIETGRDLDGDGVLGPTDVTNTVYVCQPSAPAPPSPTPGELVAVVPEPAGMHCNDGGQAIEIGLDANANGVLDPLEVTSISYVCTGADGTQELIRVNQEPAGTNCSVGGSSIHVGLDVNHDGTLEDSEIQSTTYLCGPPPNATVIYGDVTISNSIDLAQLDGVTTITGNLVFATHYIPTITLATLQSVGRNITYDGSYPAQTLSFPSLRSAYSVTLWGAQSVDLPSLATVHDMQLLTHDTAISLPALTTGAVTTGAPWLTSLSLPSLTTGSLSVSAPLTSLSLPALTTVPSNSSLQILNTNLSTLSLPSLTSGFVVVRSAPNFSSIALPLLSSGGIMVSNVPLLTTLDLPQLTSGWVAVGGADTLTTISTPVLAVDASVQVLNVPMLTSLSLPSLVSIDWFTIETNASLASISAPLLTSATTMFTITNNAMLPTCTAQALAIQSHAATVTISGNNDAATCP